MTTNKERAAEVMRGFWKDGRYAVSFDEIVRALAEHQPPLLMPDPIPHTPYRVEHTYVATSIVSNGVTVSIDGDSAWIPQDDLVSVARTLLAAAAYAEKENNDE